MSLAADRDARVFGAGGAEPYARALLGGGMERLFLTGDGRHSAKELDSARWAAEADAVDLGLLRDARGPVLDVGCGPGRMVEAALARGLAVLGIDVSPAVIRLADETGLPVLQRSVFDPLPAEGFWQTVLLVDGNIGIGGDVTAMLARCRDLLAADGEIVAELHRDPTRDRAYEGRLSDIRGNESGVFPWAEVGLDGIRTRLPALGLRLVSAWSAGGRRFCRLARV